MQIEKPYCVDGEPVTWRELIDRAESVGSFSDPSFKRTSEAAKILRAAGHEVTDNKP